MIISPLAQHGYCFGKSACRAFEVPRPTRHIALAIPLVEAFVGYHAVKHRTNFIVCLSHHAMSCQLLYHASTEPSPVATVLIDVTATHSAVKESVGVNRIEGQPDAWHATQAHVLKHLGIYGTNLFFLLQFCFDSNRRAAMVVNLVLVEAFGQRRFVEIDMRNELAVLSVPQMTAHIFV